MAFGSLALVARSGRRADLAIGAKPRHALCRARSTGSARCRRSARRSRHYQPNDAQIAYFLARFITDVRSLSIDPVVVRKNWLEAYDYATDHGAVFLNDYARQNDPFKAVGERTVSVQVTSVVRVSDSSFQVKWTEADLRPRQRSPRPSIGPRSSRS